MHKKTYYILVCCLIFSNILQGCVAREIDMFENRTVNNFTKKESV